MNQETIDAIYFISVLDDLAEKTKHGFVKYSEFTGSSPSCSIVYDDLYDNRLVRSMVFGENHYDIFDYYDDNIFESAYVNDEIDPVVVIELTPDEENTILIEDGCWRFA